MSSVTMLHAYIDAMIWADVDDKFKGYTIDPALLESSKTDCELFLAEIQEYIDENFDYEAAGHDFWLTRNHHGAGFWDGDWEHGDELTKIAHQYRSVTLFPCSREEVIYG